MTAVRSSVPADEREVVTLWRVAKRVAYEREGFLAVEFGVSPPPKSSPDVRCRWTR